MRPRAAALALACLIAASAALAQTPPLPPEPLWLVARWDGRETAPGLWLRLDGQRADGAIHAAPVRTIPEGLEIRAEAGRLQLSSDLARAWGMAPGAPLLVAVTLPDAGAASAARGEDARLAESAAEADAASAGAAADDIAAHMARVEGLFAEMAQTVGASEAGDPDTQTPAILGRERRGGLVPMGWDGAAGGELGPW
jgi:hypothetical protein